METNEQIMGKGWRSAIRDVVLVVISILIAFGLDAWWGYNRDRRDESAALVGLQTEFEGNQRLLLDAIAAHERVRASAQHLLEVIGPSAVFEPELQDYFDGILGTHTFDPLAGTLSALLASGSLGLVRDDSLRTMLASWPSWDDDIQEGEAEAKRGVEDHIVPLLSRHIPIRSVAVRADLVGGLSPSSFKGEGDELLRSMEFESLLTSRAVITIIILEEQKVLGGRLDQVLKRIHRELTR